MGVFHIFTGYDHIAFLLGVVLVGGSFKTIVKAVTAFTLAHSITLALAALDIVLLPSRIVESGIALSIMYIALENIFFRKFDRRWIITFFFGLVHGFGFASALAEVHLSGRLLGTALFAFNLGVEAGQICIVGILLPLLAWLAGPDLILQFIPDVLGIYLRDGLLLVFAADFGTLINGQIEECDETESDRSLFLARPGNLWVSGWLSAGVE